MLKNLVSRQSLNMMKNILAITCLALLIITCKKPFTPVLNQSDKRYLVIEGIISGNDSTFIKLSRSKNIDTLRTIVAENNAQVTIENDAGGSFPLAEIRSGTYAVGPLNLDNSHKYRLRVKTSDAKEYLSDFVPLKNAPPIDSVGFNAKSSGVQIYVNAHDDANATRYYRWDFTETWQFHSEYPSGYYSNGIDSIKARTVSQQVYNCFGSDSSTSVLIASTTKLNKDIVSEAPMTFISGSAEKVETKYSILVKQYALTSDAYEFWETLQKNTEKLGSIFDVLPSETQSNFHCVSNPGELVVGYLSAGNVSQKRIFITASQLPHYTTDYPYGCQLDTAWLNPPRSGSYLENILIPASSPYGIVNALYLQPANPFGLPSAYNFSTKLCVDCTLRGKRTPPSYWK
ncbi:DUF4249 domain-containing protein [Mucilaginibacter sp. BT774]|uniref:DUF4249 domain-containing protein n=1 Tax=Mucilaginibacter sp. BT774 TaxID=3062276 RepID=UPI00267510F8|nr:DUF4249 domain-containing protein [Mucilaginibacter sp. BT774]MDO3628378.1 DUF4249 domain-containing protein [Mucilaginibacter sp. BT774]